MSLNLLRFSFAFHFFHFSVIHCDKIEADTHLLMGSNWLWLKAVTFRLRESL